MKRLVIGISTLGASAPGARIAKEYGFTAESIVNKIKTQLSRISGEPNE
jgi:transketolase